MNLGRVDVPDDCNVIMEIPMYAVRIKYEIDKRTGAMFVDRFLATAMRYPCNYGYVPRTLSGDGDLPEITLAQISHFFEHYKDLERGKWVKVLGWAGPEDAKREILAGIAAYKKVKKKPAF